MSGSAGIGGFALVVVLGLVFSGFGGYMWIEQGDQIDSFRPTDATIVSSDLGIDREVGDDDGDDTTYYPDITYEYTVDGKRYRSSNIYPGPGRTLKGEQWAQGVVDDHPLGDEVTAYYDPENPSETFLIEKRETMFLVFGGIGGLAILGGVVGMLKQVAGFVL